LKSFSKVFSISLILLFFSVSQGQIYLKTTGQSRPVLQLNFQKQSATWDWQQRFMFFADTMRAWRFWVNNVAKSNLIIPSSHEHKWKDENILKGYFYYHKSLADLGLYSRSWLQNDRQFSASNKFSNHTLGLFVRADAAHWYAAPYAGYQQAQNRTHVDWGWDIGMSGGVKNITLDTYRANLDWESNYDFYAKRQNFENKFNAGIHTRFTPFSGDSLYFRFSENSKQYYVGDSIEQVKIYNRDWYNMLFYRLSTRNRLEMRTHIQSKDITYYNGRNVFLLDQDMRFSHVGRKLNYILTFRTNDQTQDNAGIKTDSRTRQTAMGIQLTYLFQKNRYLDVNFSYIKLQYDTPDTVYNNDDRDEQRFVVTLNYHHRFSPLFVMEWHAYTYLFHQMYIFKEQSANNNWNRVYKLSPRLIYHYGPIYNRLKSEVLANYTVYDFESILGQQRSFVFRKYTLSDSLTAHIYQANYAGAFARLELEDKGFFFPKNFAQQLLQSYKSQFYNFFVYNDRFMNFRITLGYNMYRRQEWRHVPVKRRTRDITNKGPYISVLYHRSKRLIFSASAALSYLNDSAGRSTSYSTGYLRMRYAL